MAVGAIPACKQAGKAYKEGRLYDVLGVKKTASQAEIRRAFKKMSVQCKDLLETTEKRCYFVCALLTWKVTRTKTARTQRPTRTSSPSLEVCVHVRAFLLTFLLDVSLVCSASAQHDWLRILDS